MTYIPTVLFVDDDRNLLDSLLRFLHGTKLRMLAVHSAAAALDLLEEESVDVLVADDAMPGMSGVELVSEVRKRWPEVVSIMFSGQTTVGGLVTAINEGEIFRFLIKPCHGLAVQRALRQALAHKMVLDQCRQLLPLMRRQRALVSALERKMPGICRSVEAEVPTDVSIDPDHFTNLNELAEHIEVEIQQSETLLGQAVTRKMNASGNAE